MGFDFLLQFSFFCYIYINLTNMDEIVRNELHLGVPSYLCDSRISIAMAIMHLEIVVRVQYGL